MKLYCGKESLSELPSPAGQTKTQYTTTGRGKCLGGEVLGEGKCSFGVTAIRNKKTGKYPAQRTFQSKTKTHKMKWKKFGSHYQEINTKRQRRKQMKKL